MGARRPLSLLSSRLAGCPFCLAAPGDFVFLRFLRHPVSVDAWLQGGVSFVGSRAFLLAVSRGACLLAVKKSGRLPASRQCLPSTAWPVFRVVGFGRLSGSLAKYRQQLSECPAVSLLHGLFICLPGAAWVPGTLSPCPGVCPCGCAETQQCPCFSGGGLFGSWVPGASLTIRVFDLIKPSGSSVVGFPAVRPSGCPTLGSRRVSSSLPSGSPPVLSLLLAALIPSRRRPRP